MHVRVSQGLLSTELDNKALLAPKRDSKILRTMMRERYESSPGLVV